jgi:hypothetical protein
MANERELCAEIVQSGTWLYDNQVLSEVWIGEMKGQHTYCSNSGRYVSRPLISPTSVVREIRTLRSVGAGGGRLPPATRWAHRNTRPYRDPYCLSPYCLNTG